MEVRLLGEVAVLVDGRGLDLGPARQRCVLAALAVDVGRVVSVDVLTERVWGERPPRRARATLVSYLSRLRQVLAAVGAAHVVRAAGGYSLEAGRSAVDLHVFHDLCARARAGDDRQRVALLEEALGLWRGEALSGLDGDWSATERDRLHQLRLNAEHDLADALLRLGHGEDLLAGLSASVADHPLDERVAGQYLLALYRAGRAADALEHYRRVRERLVEELGTDPGRALQELHRRILTADPALTAAPADTTPVTVASESVVPRQLPAAPTPFVGRGGELDRLDAALRTASDASTTVVISAIAGAGGIGKTSLALHWAHRHADRFPDGQLFVNLRGFSPDGEPMDPAVALRGLLDALGVEPGRIPADLHARAALFRSLLADRRMLLVLDNAADTTQVAPLLPGDRSCTVVVTSRNRLSGLITGHGARNLSVDTLTDTEARALLTDRLGTARVGAEPAAVEELIRLCGGFPLALSIMAGRAHTHPHLTLAALAAELRDSAIDTLDDTDPTASLPAVLSSSHRALTGEQAQAFGLLAIAPGPDIGLPAAANLTGLTSARTRTVLRALEQASLIIQDADGRYRMHDLVRAYATTTAHSDLSDDMRKAALERVVDFYLRTAQAADHLLDPSRDPIRLDPGAHPQPLPDHPSALAWLDIHHPHLLAAQHAATAHHSHQAVWHLAWTLHTFHRRRGHRHDELAVWQAAADAATHLPDPATRIRAHRFLGHAHAELKRHEQAIRHLHQALALAEHHHNPTQQAHTHRALAQAWVRQGDDRQAMEHARHALHLDRTLDQPVREADALNSVGWLAARLGDYDTARTHCQAALTLYRQHHDPEGETNALDSLGFIAHHTGHHDQALHHYQRALTLRRALGNTTAAADTLDNLGHPHSALGHHDQARSAWQEALELYRRQGRDDDAERALRQLDALDQPDGG
nr:BTAD domain-containing putative transcriptional regulator [Saccharothrix sp. NRRL B-16348]